MIEIDGSMYEGGGQIIRTALALSCVTGKAFHAVNIRKSRPAPGLKAQHLTCIKALEELCSAKTENAELGSEEFSFSPKEINGGSLEINIGTAGSITLLLQSLLIPCLYSRKQARLKITGGTDVSWSPQIDYFSNVFLPHIKKYAKKIELRLLRRGYYPKGHGKIDLLIDSKDLEDPGKISLTEQGSLIQVKGISHASRDLMKAEVAERQAKQARLLLSKLNCPVRIAAQYSDTESTGSGITLYALFSSDGDDMEDFNMVVLGSDVLGKKGKKAEEVGKEAAEKLIEIIDSKSAVDPHLADQLVPFLKLFGGEIKTNKITPHYKANEYVCKKFGF